MKFLNHNLFTGDITVNGTTTLSTATGVTRPTGDNTTHLATTAFVKAQDYATNTALGNYVPISRTLTINGVTYDLSADRSWTIATSDYTSTVKHVVKAEVAITKGQAVYVTSADGTNMIVGLASNATEATSSKTMGLAETTVSANGFTNVITEGLLAGLDTSTAGTEGDPVWLGTNGNLIYGLANKPYAPAHLVFIGIVTRKNANNGEIFVKVQNGFELNEIHDVDLKTVVPVNGHILGFDGTLWVNKTIAGWLGYTPANASGTTNYVSKFTGTTTLGNSQIFDNGTNVGIGTTSPDSKLHVVSTGSNVFRMVRSQNNFGFEATSTSSGGYGLYDYQNSAYDIYLQAGKVGIGTTAPNQRLSVENGNIQLNANNAAANYYLFINKKTGQDGGILFNRDNNNDWQLTNHSTLGDLVFYSYGTASEAITFKKGTGNVGIGTTSPSNKLQVANGDMSITSGYSFILADTDTNWRLGRNIISPVESVYLNSNTFEFVAANASDQGWQFINDDGYPVLEIGAATGSRNVWVNAGNLLVPTGSVGIGTASPSHRLHVTTGVKANSVYIGMSDNFTTRSGDGDNLYIKHPLKTSGGWWGVNVELSGAVSGHTAIFYPFRYLSDENSDGSAETIWSFIDKNGGAYFAGNLGIGIDTPSEKLHVVGRARITTIDNGTGDFATISGTGVITRRTAAQVLSDIGAQPSGSYLTAESDTLATVTSRGATTTTAITIQGGWASTILDGDNVVLRKPNYSSGGWARTLLNFQEYTTTSLFQIGGYGSNNVMTYGYLGSAYNTPTFRWYANKDVVFDGNVGLGVVSPGNKLVVDGVAQSTIAKFYTSDNNYSTIEVGDTGDVYASVYMQTNSGNGQLFKYGSGWGTESGMVGLYSSNGPIALQAGGSTKVFVASGGNVGVGTSSPGTKLDVNGVITATGGNSTNWNTAYGWGNHASAGYLTSYTETDTLATVTSRGSSTNGSIFINGIFTGGLGAVTTSGTLDWNDVSNARAGQGYTLLLGTATNGMGGGQYYHPVSFEYSSKNGSGNMTQLAIPYTGNGIWYRNRYGGSWSSWARVWDDSSFTSTNITNWNTAYGWGNHASQGYATQTYVNTAIANLVDSAPSTLDTLNELAAALGDDPNFATTVTNSIAAKLPLAGGTMTGTIYFSNDMGTALQGTIGDNDFWRIRGGNAGSNAGFLEIATSDDGTEPIYVRQYTGVFSSLTRTATLLDGSGNTSLPGSLTVGGTITENSSIRYKENIVDLESATEKVEQLRAVRYNKIGHEVEEIGLIAEEVAEVYPEVVNYNEEGQPDGVNYTRLSVILLKAVQELTERINKLESK